MTIVGITGGIATGKSTVTTMLAEKGAPTLSADDISRRQMQPGMPVTLAVLDAFPFCADRNKPESVDRRLLGEYIFKNNAARKTLEAITHPPIINVLQATANMWREQKHGCGVLEIPLLFEAHLEALVDKIAVVTCSDEKQLIRLSSRLGIDYDAAKYCINSQMPLLEKSARADRIITTNGTYDATRNQVELLWKEYCQ